MILSGHQPVYLPGLVLFDKIAKSDVFMFVGHCQFEAKSWQIRNRIRGIKGAGPYITLSVPVHKNFGQSINNTEIFGDHWKRKHLKAITQTYQKRPYFARYFPSIERTLLHDWKFLGDMNSALILLMLPWFGIDTKVCFSNEYPIDGHKTDMLISMCNQVGADVYLSGVGSKVYVREDLFLEAGLAHKWQDFTHPIYDQGGKGPFVPNLSAIDCLFNCGEAAKEFFKP